MRLTYKEQLPFQYKIYFFLEKIVFPFCSIAYIVLTILLLLKDASPDLIITCHLKKIFEWFDDIIRWSTLPYYDAINSSNLSSLFSFVSLETAILTVIAALIIYFLGRLKDVEYGFGLYRIILYSAKTWRIVFYFTDFMVMLVSVFLTQLMGFRRIALLCALAECVFLAMIAISLVASTRRMAINHIIRMETGIRIKKKIKAENKSNALLISTIEELPLVTLIENCDYRMDVETREIWRGMVTSYENLLLCNARFDQIYDVVLFLLRRIFKSSSIEDLHSEQLNKLLGVTTNLMGIDCFDFYSYSFNAPYYMQDFCESEKSKAVHLKDECLNSNERDCLFLLAIFTAIILERKLFGSKWEEMFCDLFTKLDANTQDWLFLPILAFIEHIVWRFNVESGSFTYLIHGFDLIYQKRYQFGGLPFQNENILLFSHKAWKAWSKDEVYSNDYPFWQLVEELCEYNNPSVKSTYVVNVMYMYH